MGRPDKGGGIPEIEAGLGTTVILEEGAAVDESDATECDWIFETRWSKMASSMSSSASAAYRQLISSGTSAFNSYTRRCYERAIRRRKSANGIIVTHKLLA